MARKVIGLSTTRWWLHHTLLNQSLTKWCQTKNQDKEMIIANCIEWALILVWLNIPPSYKCLMQNRNWNCFVFFALPNLVSNATSAIIPKKKKCHFIYDILKYHWMETRKRKDHSMADWMLQLFTAEIQEQQIFWWNKQCTLCVSWCSL